MEDQHRTGKMMLSKFDYLTAMITTCVILKIECVRPLNVPEDASLANMALLDPNLDGPIQFLKDFLTALD